MSNPHGDACPIWGYDVQISPEITQEGLNKIVKCPRAGGRYRITLQAEQLVAMKSEPVKARLTTMIIDEHLQGVEFPEITLAMIEEAEQRKPLSIPDRTTKLLQYFYYEAANAVQRYTDVRELVDYSLLFPHGDLQLAWSESISEQATRHLFAALVHRGFIEERITSDFRGYGLTMEGVQCIESLYSAPVASQVFVVMWFDEETNDAYEYGIKPAIESAGYVSVRIDREHFLGKIDDEIIAHIRRSRFRSRRFFTR